jgi:hypothetical protein
MSTASEPTAEETTEREQHIKNMCEWLGSKDVSITGSIKQKNIANALYDDGWATKETLIDMFKSGDLTEHLLGTLITTTGDRVKLIKALKQSCSTLTIEPPVDPSLIVAATKSNIPSVQQHVMISYNWNHQLLVRELARQLRRRNHDIWCDEDGSSLLNNMAALGLFDGMSAAIENCNCGIVCVSRDYVKSENCLLELKYLKTLKKDVIWVLMQSDFTPSSPDFRGPVPLLMSGAIYHSLFDKLDIPKVSAALSAILSTKNGETKIVSDEKIEKKYFHWLHASFQVSPLSIAIVVIAILVSYIVLLLRNSDFSL